MSPWALLSGCLTACLLVQYLPPEWTVRLWSPSHEEHRSALPAGIASATSSPSSTPAAESVPVMTAMGDFTGFYQLWPPEADPSAERRPTGARAIPPPWPGNQRHTHTDDNTFGEVSRALRGR